MPRAQSTRGPVDEMRTLRLEVVPWVAYTEAVLSLESRNAYGRSHSVLARWHLRLTRADLAGHSTDDVLRVVLDRVLHRLDSAGDPADYRAAVGLSAPVGATGATVTKASPEGGCDGSQPLPGL